jgi:hypothetical protein
MYSEFILKCNDIIILIWVGTTVVDRGSWLTLSSETLQYLTQLIS